MRVFSVVFIFATVALFGVTARRVCNYEGCSLDCPRSDNDTYACTHFEDFSITSTACESNQIVHCAMEEEGKAVTVTEGPCNHTYTNCNTACGEGKEVCANHDGRLRNFRSLCDYAGLVNCYEVERNDPGAQTFNPIPTYELLGYGNCGPDAREFG